MNKFDIFALLKIFEVNCGFYFNSSHVLITIDFIADINLGFNKTSMNISLSCKLMLVFTGVLSNGKAFILKPIEKHDVALHLDRGFFAYKFQERLVVV